MKLTRILAVLAAANMVVAFALAALMPTMMTLGQLIGEIGNGAPQAVRDFFVEGLSPWVWLNIAMPLLLRPGWLLPACVGIVFAGGAMTLSSMKDVPRSHRRRS